jgi:hypothetical protein
MKDTIICFRITRELRDILQRISRAERRSLSSTVENILYSYLQGRAIKEFKTEQRRYPRKKLDVPVLVRDKNGVIYPGGTGDISLGGVRLSVRGDFKCGIGEDFALSLVFALPEAEKALSLTCVPRHVSGIDQVRIGASFDDSGSPDYDYLSQYLTN